MKKQNQRIIKKIGYNDKKEQKKINDKNEKNNTG